MDEKRNVLRKLRVTLTKETPGGKKNVLKSVYRASWRFFVHIVRHIVRCKGTKRGIYR